MNGAFIEIEVRTVTKGEKHGYMEVCHSECGYTQCGVRPRDNQGCKQRTTVRGTHNGGANGADIYMKGAHNLREAGRVPVQP